MPVPANTQLVASDTTMLQHTGSPWYITPMSPFSGCATGSRTLKGGKTMSRNRVVMYLSFVGSLSSQ